jgi:hypothetical protein
MYLGLATGLHLTRREDSMNNKRLFHAFFVFLLLIAGSAAVAQQVPQERPPADVAGNWVIYTKGDDGKTGTHTVTLIQNGATLTGHFKGPYQSGGIEGTINVRHIVFKTKTRNVLTFRGMVDGNTMEGNFGVRGQHGTWEARRPD